MPELNIDGLVGPTHNYAGLSYGNLASQNNLGQIANPKAAALQGLGKMRTLIKLGVPQAVMPPHERPFIPMLKALGFSGSDKQILKSVWDDNPSLLANHSSASSMWTANAATVSPSMDCQDSRVHLTPANLSAMPHRSIEAVTTRRLLSLIFKDETHFKVHHPLPAQEVFGDEGAANHNRLSAEHEKQGVELFVYGRKGLDRQSQKTRFPGRQTHEASAAIARKHGLTENNTVFAQQSSVAIDAGAFHNDVVCVTNGNVMFYHEDAFVDDEGVRDELRRKSASYEFDPIFLQASRKELPLADAVKSYIFNSQIVTLPNGSMALILPKDAEENQTSNKFVMQCLEEDNPITHAHFLDLRQSMSNGGGPACLRLRVQLTPKELASIHQPVLMTSPKLDRLETWVNKHYRDRLIATDLADPNFMDETRVALDELTKILDMGSFYPFQCNQSPDWNDND